MFSTAPLRVAWVSVLGAQLALSASGCDFTLAFSGNPPALWGDGGLARADGPRRGDGPRDGRGDGAKADGADDGAKLPDGPWPEGTVLPDAPVGLDRALPPDSKPPSPDQGQPKPDSRPPSPDQGQPKPDSKPPTPDQGVPTPDQGVPTPDQGGGGLYTGSFPTNTNPGFRWGNLTVKGVARQVRLYFPNGGLAAKPRLVILFHGTDGHGEDDIWGATGPSFADAQKLLIAAPEARSMSKGDWDNHNAGQRYFETYPNVSPSTNNDLQLVQAIIDAAQKAYNVDTKRVYAMGFSNGAFFAALAATALPNQIAAFASNGGGLVRCATTDSCTFTGSGTSCSTLASQGGWCSCSGAEKPGPIPGSGRKPPAYVVTAANDFVVSPYYSCQLASRLTAQGFTVSITVRGSGGHSWPNNFAANAWPFLSQVVLP